MERRQFIRSSCNLCMLAASGFLFSEMAACSPAIQVFKSDIIDDSVQIPLIAFEKPGLKIIRPKGWFYDIAVQKTDNGYEALLLRCTHQNNQVIPMGSGFFCEQHGSSFNRSGKVTKGPAEYQLRSFATSVLQDKLIIHINLSGS
jgi:Rieske Fe-S protein